MSLVSVKYALCDNFITRALFYLGYHLRFMDTKVVSVKTALPFVIHQKLHKYNNYQGKVYRKLLLHCAAHVLKSMRGISQNIQASGLCLAEPRTEALFGRAGLM